MCSYFSNDDVMAWGFDGIYNVRDEKLVLRDLGIDICY
jgi:hypothetical protein